jgi:hypothetical protein
MIELGANPLEQAAKELDVRNTVNASFEEQILSVTQVVHCAPLIP